eukprot:NODE_2775_length_877_cov_141.322384.p2 GENE.NODE_2775_length_877_cov_141.322384~~NODE_2775_length_877_cov_141.322384.p2  ORF type:complete len:128 (-),score=12.29 NODE_2775_length_877_cov_141.322384:205-588(-)
MGRLSSLAATRRPGHADRRRGPKPHRDPGDLEIACLNARGETGGTASEANPKHGSKTISGGIAGDDAVHGDVVVLKHALQPLSDANAVGPTEQSDTLASIAQRAKHDAVSSVPEALQTRPSPHVSQS